MLKFKTLTWLDLLLSLGLFTQVTALAFANSSSVTHAQTQIQALDKQIGHLEKTLQTQDQEKKHLLDTLANTDKKISQTWQDLNQTQQKIINNQKKIDLLQSKLSSQEKELKQQEAQLASHIRTRYQMNQYQPLKWLLNQEKPEHYSRILTLYQYLIQSRLTLISQIKNSKKELSKNQNLLENELNTQRHLQQTLSKQHESLAITKNREHDLIEHLEQDLANKKQKLIEIKKNKANLSQLLKQLAAQSVAKPRYPITQMRRKLPRPITNPLASTKRQGQGIKFITKEGDVVHAVYPGKIVFSDWLNGYGLLIIIDHGQGFMSLYAHNQSLYKRKGEAVSQNEQIASVGHSGGNRENGLYFEIRQGGKAVSPLEWLS